MALITGLSAFLEPLGYANLTASEQAYIDAYLEAASGYLEKRLNRTLAAADYAEIHNGDNKGSLNLKNPPINSLTQVVVVGCSNTTYDATCFLYSSGGTVRWNPYSSETILNYFPMGFQNITVTYNGGFTTIPAALQALVAEMVLESWDPSLLSSGMQKERLGQYFYDRGKDFWDKILFKRSEIVALYKRHIIPWTPSFGECY